MSASFAFYARYFARVVELIKSQHLERFIGYITRKSRDAPFNFLHAMTRMNGIAYNDR